MLNEYTVLVPKTQAATPTYYGTESGVDFYSSLTSKATYSVKKLSITGNNLSKWTKASVDLVMTFLNVPELTIPWSLGDRRKFCVIDAPRQYENLRLSQE